MAWLARRGGVGPRLAVAWGERCWAAGMGGVASGVGGRNAAQSGPLPPRLTGRHARSIGGLGVALGGFSTVTPQAVSAASSLRKTPGKMMGAGSTSGRLPFNLSVDAASLDTSLSGEPRG